MVSEARAFQQMGLSVLLVDFRGSWESSESYTTIGYHEAKDVAASVRYAEDNLPYSRLMLFGQSLGAVAVLRAIYRYDVKPDAVIVEAVFDKLLNSVKNRFHLMGIPPFPSAQLLIFWAGMQLDFNGFRHNPVDYVTRIDCPILFLHGTDDKRARISEARRVYDAVTAPKTMKEFRHARHAPYVEEYTDEWEETVRNFLDFLDK